ncbi:transglutaminase-like cysteine peptidase [Oceanimonas baumannii]|uniref:Sulfate adenylyltransferase n=1 Tax=Oceanimonas baumannii TaxID=129578 RepID=A0A235CN44_9GAMM|nr:transglutaminase-like cysteine peptidase [Oceanimonas baumannii]OYD25983.1 sulfate adenylyltransferase [Oceanimonas baumannii]TDW59994.1 putative transglutaminase-like cysteine proteinase [Oceanimonas baumannii]
MRPIYHRLYGLVLLSVLLGVPAWSLEEEDSHMRAAVQSVYGSAAAGRLAQWRRLVREGQSVGWDEQQAMTRINGFFNRLAFVDDIRLWAKNDYWATPMEFIGAGGGDCEDFSLAKYFSLRELGVADHKLRLVYVKALELNQFHMVVAYYPTPASVPLILDNLKTEIMPATQRGDLAPIYSFNGEHLWLMKERGRGELAGESSRLSLWNDLRSRLNTTRLKRPAINLD